MDQLYGETQRMVRDLVRRFAEFTVPPAARDIDRGDEFPAQIYRRLAETGLFGANQIQGLIIARQIARQA